jgi:capsule polysaccharide export protein KpsE/RkpR
MSSPESSGTPTESKDVPAKPAPAKPAAAPKPAAAAQPAPSGPAAKPQGPSAIEVARRIRRERARRLLRALVLWVVVPTLLGAIYYGFVAATQYESVATLVMSADAKNPQVAATILREHLLSRDMLRKLESHQQLREHYRQGGDAFSRLPAQARSETRYRFYRDHVDARYDAQTHVFTLTVRAFSGAAAQQFAKAMLQESRDFVMAMTHSQASPFVVVAQPSAPDEASYPRRGYSILTVFFASLALFAIGSLLIGAVREHAQF